MCDIHRIPVDEVGGRLGFQITQHPPVVYCRDVITRGGDSGYKGVSLAIFQTVGEVITTGV